MIALLRIPQVFGGGSRTYTFRTIIVHQSTGPASGCNASRRLYRKQASQTVAKETILPSGHHGGSDGHLARPLTLAHKTRVGGTHERQTQAQAIIPHSATAKLPAVPTQTKSQSEQHDLSDASSRSNTAKLIPNPLIPRELAPSVAALFAQVNSFAKAYGFGVVKAHSMV
ncbi:hypothetical protein VFPPC_17051 [Pochonia chlamydosporia 170]|uniref:Uncharacterized protein n=1 Tax=Pochonia chlamydosporia 170 TaxID=1380566 RepID=A0A179EYD0_METCM|nr:hypothetical protein VFPPC_17051 [Pochonia chlamydosporia 170]OAQ58010.2 hypothetical protein VFPPC_17051 [Pochonia chlamydosporia 170]